MTTRFATFIFELLLTQKLFLASRKRRVAVSFQKENTALIMQPRITAHDSSAWAYRRAVSVHYLRVICALSCNKPVAENTFSEDNVSSRMRTRSSDINSTTGLAKDESKSNSQKDINYIKLTSIPN